MTDGIVRAKGDVQTFRAKIDGIRAEVLALQDEDRRLLYQLSARVNRGCRTVASRCWQPSARSSSASAPDAR
jgi:hypothetical protein